MLDVLVTTITQHEASLVTVSTPEYDGPVVSPPAAPADSAGVHVHTPTLAAGPPHHLRVLEHKTITPPTLPGILYLERS